MAERHMNSDRSSGVEIRLEAGREVASIIEMLGGTRALRELCGVGTTAVSNWRVWNRFPEGKHRLLSRAAAAKGFAIPDALFQRP